MVGEDIVIRFSLVHLCVFVATQARLVSASSGRVFTFHSLVILDPSEESSHGLWSLYLPRSVIWLL